MAVTVGVAGCGGSDGSTETQASTSPEPAATTESKPPAPEEPTDELTAAQIRKAEEVVKDELPAVPLWEGTTFHGEPTADGDVCVERMYSKHSAEVFGGSRNAGLVIVSIPSMTTGEPQDGTCGHPSPDPDERLAVSELDALANELALAIETDDDSEILSTAARVKATIDKPLPILTKQANLIHSATVAATEGVNVGDEKQLEAALRFLNEATRSP